MGTSGRRGDRFDPVMPSGRTLPDWMCGIALPTSITALEMCPASRSAISGGVPRYGEWACPSL